jgi:transcriptional regulator with XRE-family HTH domain
MRPELPIQPSEQNIGNYLRTRRRKAGLSQREMRRLFGYADEGAVSRRELSKTSPPLSTLIAYEIIFQYRVSELFPAVRDRMATSIEQRLPEFENELQEKTAKGSRAPRIAQKLKWLSERRKTRAS